MLLEEGIGNEKHLGREDEPDEDGREEGLYCALRTEGRGNVETYGILDLHSTEKASHQEEYCIEKSRKLSCIKIFDVALTLCKVQSGEGATRRKQSSKIIKD